MKKTVSCVVVLLLAAVLAGLLVVNRRQDQRHAAHMQQLQAEARPYEREISQIRSDLAQREQAIQTSDDTSGILFGFVPTTVDDLAQIDKLAAAYDIAPVIILDCSQEKATLTALLQKAAARNYEVVFAGLQFDEDILQTADELKALLAQTDEHQSPAFLLRRTVDTKANRQLLQQHGYTDLILYTDSLQSGMLDNGDPYICYGFFRSPSYYPDYLAQIVSAHTMMLASFDFAAIHDGTLKITDVENFIALADKRKTADELRYMGRLSSAFQAAADQNATQQERQEAYETYQAEQEKRIAELEEKINAIYDHWNEE